MQVFKLIKNFMLISILIISSYASSSEISSVSVLPDDILELSNTQSSTKITLNSFKEIKETEEKTGLSPIILNNNYEDKGFKSTVRKLKRKNSFIISEESDDEGYKNANGNFSQQANNTLKIMGCSPRNFLPKNKNFKISSLHNLDYSSSNDSNGVRILSLNGGGIRCIMQLYFLAKLEQETGKPTAELFDVFTGTSGGAINVCALTLPDPDNPTKPKYTAKKLLEMTLNDSSKIFPHRNCLQKAYDLISCKKLRKPKYNNNGLLDSLKKTFVNNNFSDRLKPTIVTAYEINMKKAFEFNSFNAKDGEDFLTYEVCASSAAAPTYFPLITVKPINNKADATPCYMFSDGGTYANDPILSGCATASTLYPNCPLEKMTLVSLGTGQTTKTPHYSLKNAGIYGWGSNIIDVFMDGQASYTAQKCRQLFYKNYYNFNPHLSELDLDNVSTKYVNSLLLAAERNIEQQVVDFNKMVTKITKRP